MQLYFSFFNYANILRYIEITLVLYMRYIVDNYELLIMAELLITCILVNWLECRFLDTEVDGSNPGISMLCP